MQLRDYQQECIDTLESRPPGRYLVQMATGLGKTVTFANLPRHGDMLLLSHREELVRQPLKYFDCSTGVEMAADHSRTTDEVVSASVQSLVHRLEQFDPYRFHTIIVDEAHHAAARTYRKVLDYFQPEVETVIVARPTQSDSLYAQMVGRGLRLHPDKDKLTLIDCVGITGRASLCTAPTLLGIDIDSIPQAKQQEVQGMLFELPEKAERASDCPQSWIRNMEIVQLWAKQQQYDTRGINFFRMPDGRLVCSLRDRVKLTIPCQDELGNVIYGGREMPMQQAIDTVYQELLTFHPDQRYLWDLSIVKRWGSAQATEKQVEMIRKRCKTYDVDCDKLTKFQASQILNRVMMR